MSKCAKCKTEYEGNFCPECGEKHEEPKTCPECGKTLDGQVKFCNECGHSFATQRRKSFYKQWWFYLIVAVVIAAIVGGIIGSQLQNKDSETPTGNSKPPAVKYYIGDTVTKGDVQLTVTSAEDLSSLYLGGNTYVSPEEDSGGLYHNFILVKFKLKNIGTTTINIESNSQGIEFVGGGIYAYGNFLPQDTNYKLSRGVETLEFNYLIATDAKISEGNHYFELTLHLAATDTSSETEIKFRVLLKDRPAEE